MIRFYAYKGCDSCRRARKWLQTHEIDFAEIAIREQPPSLEELQQALKAKGQIKALFNTSGVDYRQMGLKDKLATLSEAAALKLLAANGNLVKRPFVIGSDLSLVGFKEPEWLASF
jgi:arsenate reductase